MADSPILLQKDNTFTKLFVGGLPYHTTDETLLAYFQQFGDIEEAVVIHDRVTRKSKGYGFVTMSDKESAERACANPNPVIEGRRANVNLAYIGAKPKSHSQSGRSSETTDWEILSFLEELGRDWSLTEVALTPESPIAGLQSPIATDPFSHQSPPPLPFGLQTQGFIIPGPGCPPFSPPPPMVGPLLYPPYFNPQFGFGPPMTHGPMNFPPQAMPHLVPYNAAN